LFGLIIIEINQKQIKIEQIIEYWARLSSLQKLQFPIFVAALATYIGHIIRDKDFVPNPLAFGIWLLGDTVSFLTYIRISELWLAPAIMPTGALIVFVYSLLRSSKEKKKENENHGGFMPPDQIVALVLALIALALWAWSDMDIVANMAIQVSLAIGFYFIIASILEKKSSNEPVISWWLFLIGWSVATYETALLYKTNWEFVLPLVNGGGALLILLITYYYQRSRV
jgi:hypothetical protein